MAKAFLYDTWAFVALSNRADPYHELAVEADHALEQAGLVPTTTDYVLDETITGVHVSAGAAAAAAFIDVVTTRIDCGELMLLEITSVRRLEALSLFRRMASETPRLSFTDCTSMVVMLECGIELAFTGDAHFHRGGRGIRPLFQKAGSSLVRLPLESAPPTRRRSAKRSSPRGTRRR